MSSYIPERLDARGINLGSRIVASATVVASPALAAETVICQVTAPSNLQTFSQVIIEGQAAWTQGTSGTAYHLRIRQTGTSGTSLFDSGAIAATATTLVNTGAMGIDTAPAAGQVYVLTLQVTGGAATSTVSAAALTATFV